jgi:hypothetical protein
MEDELVVKRQNLTLYESIDQHSAGILSATHQSKHLIRTIFVSKYI